MSGSAAVLWRVTNDTWADADVPHHRLVGVLSRFTNTKSSGAGVRDQGGAEIRDQNQRSLISGD
jgi:hypothetical protein